MNEFHWLDLLRNKKINKQKKKLKTCNDTDEKCHP